MSGAVTIPGNLSPTEHKLWVVEAVDWVWGLAQGGFNEKQSLSQIIVDAMIGMIPLVGDVTAARDLTAHSMHMAHDEEKRNNKWQWLLLVVFVFALIPVVGGVIKGVGRIAATATRDTTVLAKCAEDIVAVLNRLGHGNAEKWFRSLKVLDYQAQVLERLHSAIDTMILCIVLFVRKAGRLLPESSLQHLRHLQTSLQDLRKMAADNVPHALEELHDRLEHLQALVHNGGVPALTKAEKAAVIHAQTGQKVLSYVEEARLVEQGVKRIGRAGKYPQNASVAKEVAKVYKHQAGFPDLLGRPDEVEDFILHRPVSTFSGPIKNEELSGETVWRAFGPGGSTKGKAVKKTTPEGVYWGRGPVPKTAEEWRRRAAVLDEFNRNGWLCMVHIPPTSKMKACTGTISEQFGNKIKGQFLEGGGQQAFITELADVKDVANQLFAKGGGHAKVKLADGVAVEVEIRGSHWTGKPSAGNVNGKINGVVGYEYDAVSLSGSITERLGATELQTKLAEESRKKAIEHAGKN